MDLRDSVNKTISRFFWGVTKESFEFGGKVFEPKELRVSPEIFLRRMTCVSHCGACCRRFTLDWLPEEHEDLPRELKEHIVPRRVDFNGKEVLIYSDTQEDHEDYYCRNLGREDGRCGIHTCHPFSCDFELLRFKQSDDLKVPTQFSHAPFGRAWQMLRVVDGERGGLCEWYDKPCDEGWKDEITRRLLRLQDWTDHFGLRTHISQIVKWVIRGPHKNPLILGRKTEGGFEIG